MTKRIDDVRRAAEKDLANIKQTLQFAQNKVRGFRNSTTEGFLIHQSTLMKLGCSGGEGIF